MQCPSVVGPHRPAHQQSRAAPVINSVSCGLDASQLSRHQLLRQLTCRCNGNGASRKALSAVALTDATLSIEEAVDPTLDSLIDRWLSNRLASTSEPTADSSIRSSSRGDGTRRSRFSTNGDGSKRSTASKRQGETDCSQQQFAWEAVVGPVTTTLDSLSSLDDDSDELYVLADSLQQLAGSLQELQAVVLQLQQLQLQQQQLSQQDADKQQYDHVAQQQQEVAAVQQVSQDSQAQLSHQLQLLLVTSANQVNSLPDPALLNLLAISVVVLAPTGSSRGLGTAGTVSVASAAAAAARKTLTELAQRPEAAAGLTPAQLTSLSVVLHRLGRQLGLSHVIPRDLVVSVFKQTQVQIQGVAASQLAVVVWCLNGLGVAPPSHAVMAVLDAAAAAAARGQLDGLGVRRLSAALLNMRHYFAAAVLGSSSDADSSSKAGGGVSGSVRVHGGLRKALNNFIYAASHWVLQSTGSSSAAPAAAPAATDWRAVVSVAQLSGLYCKSRHQQQLLMMIADHLAGPGSADGGSSSSSSSTFQDAAAAAGYMLPFWPGTLAANQQQQLVATMLDADQQQRQQQQHTIMESFLSATLQSGAAAAAAGLAQGLHPVLDIMAEQLLQRQQQQQQSNGPSVAADTVRSYAMLLKLFVAVQHHQSAQLPALFNAAVAAAAAADCTSPEAAAAAAADVATALCVLQPAGWLRQLDSLQLKCLSATELSQLPAGLLIQLAAAAAKSAAQLLAAAALHQLGEPQSRDSLTVTQAVELLGLTAEQIERATQQQQQQQLNDQQLPGTCTAIFKQCLHCMSRIQSNARGIAPGQIAPLLGSMLQLQQYWQQQPQPQQDHVPLYRDLHRELLAAVALQLEDAVRYMQPQQVSDAVKYLAWISSSSSSSSSSSVIKPALGAVVTALYDQRVLYTISQLTWVLWGITKLKYTKHGAFKRLLKHTLGRVAEADKPAATAAAGPPPQQQQGSDLTHATEVADEDSGASARDGLIVLDADRSAAAAVDGPGPLDQLVVLLWVSAHAAYHNKCHNRLLNWILNHVSAPSVAQVSSVMWAFTRLWQIGGFRQQQQQQQQVLQWMEGWLERAAAVAGGADAAVRLSVKSSVNIAWACHKLGYVPSAAVQQYLITAVSQQQQQQQLRPAEISCFLHSIADWPSSSSNSRVLTRQQLQHLEQQLVSQLESAAAATAVDTSAVNADGCLRLLGAAAAEGTSKSDLAAAAIAAEAVAASAELVHWDGPAVCSCCHAFTKLGLLLQPQTLQVVEQYIMRLLPLSSTAAVRADAGVSRTAAAAAAAWVGAADLDGDSQQQQQQQHIRWVAPPSAADLALFGDACRRSNYQPRQLLLMFRNWLLLRIAKRGPGALLQLVGVTARRNAARAAAAATAAAAAERSSSDGSSGSSSDETGSGTSSPRGHSSSSGSSSPRAGSSSSSGSNSEIQQQLTSALLQETYLRQQQQQQQHGFHANAIISTLMFLRHTQYRDAALLQQLELLISNRPISLQLNSQQLVMALSAFWQLGFYPHNWWSSGLRRLLFRHAQGISVRDGVELLQVLSAWCDHRQISHGQATFMKQILLPRILQRLLGVEYVPRQRVAAAGGTSSAGSSPSASLGSVSLSSSDSGDISGSRSGVASKLEADQTVMATAAAAARSSAPSRRSSSNMLSNLSGSQIMSLLHSMRHLNLGDVTTPQIGSQIMIRQIMRQLQQIWSDLSVEQQVTAVHAVGRLHYDITNMLDAQQLLPQLQQEGWVRSAAAAGSSGSAVFSNPRLAARVLWAYGVVGKQPGPAVVDAALQTITAAAAAAVPGAVTSCRVSDRQQHHQQQQLPLREISNALYAAAVLHESTHPAAAALVHQLATAAAAEGKLISHPEFNRQSQQLAACLLASQIAPPRPGPAAAAEQEAAAPAVTNTAVATATINSSSSSSNPWLIMDAAVCQRLLESWRRRVLLRSQRPLHRQQQELVACCQDLGLRCRGNAVTDDGCVCIDVAAASHSGEPLAIELLGPHNAAINTQRPLGPARIKWRLLATRGYRVIVINAWQWQNLPKGGPIGQGLAKADRMSDELASQGSNGDPEGSNGGPVSPKRVRASDEQIAFLQSRIMAAGAAAGVLAAAQQQQQREGTANPVDQMQVGGSSSSSRLSALQRPIRRPGSWR